MENTLIYVDSKLSIAIAAKLVGVLSSSGKSQSNKIGINWLITSSIDEEHSSTTQVDIRELLPEDLVYLYYPHIDQKFEDLEKAIPLLNTTSSGSLKPGNVISIKGKLIFHEFDSILPEFLPFSPEDIELKSYFFHGEECIIGELCGTNHKIPIYFPAISKYQIAFCHNQPVEITGIVRWSPPYSPGGASSLNLVVRCAAVWLH